jgi:hypothetical protein
MKLYKVPRNSKIRVWDEGRTHYEDLDFSHVDGMYSLCFNADGVPVHITAWADVEVLDGSDPRSES